MTGCLLLGGGAHWDHLGTGRREARKWRKGENSVSRNLSETSLKAHPEAGSVGLFLPGK